MLLRNLDAPALADPRLIRFQDRHAQRAWTRNVVAIGMSAGFVEPLESTALHLVQMGVAKLIEAFPHGALTPSRSLSTTARADSATNRCATSSCCTTT